MIETILIGLVVLGLLFLLGNGLYEMMKPLEPYNPTYDEELEFLLNQGLSLEEAEQLLE